MQPGDSGSGKFSEGGREYGSLFRAMRGSGKVALKMLWGLLNFTDLPVFETRQPPSMWYLSTFTGIPAPWSVRFQLHGEPWLVPRMCIFRQQAASP